MLAASATRLVRGGGAFSCAAIRQLRKRYLIQRNSERLDITRLRSAVAAETSTLNRLCALDHNIGCQGKKGNY